MPQPDPRAEEGKDPPALRTMKSDVQELLKTSQPSLLDLVGEELKQRDQAARTAPDRNVPAGRSRRWVILITVLILALTAGTVLVFIRRSGPPPAQTPPPRLPRAFFATETSRTITVAPTERLEFLRLVQDSADEPEREGSMKRLLIKIEAAGTQRFARPGDLFSLYRIQPPEEFVAVLEPDLMLFLHYGLSGPARPTGGPRLGFAARTREPGRILRILLGWERRLAQDLGVLFLRETIPSTLPEFEDRTYRNIDWRFQKLSSEKDLGIGYGIFPAQNLLILTTGKSAMESVINRLFDVR